MDGEDVVQEALFAFQFALHFQTDHGSFALGLLRLVLAKVASKNDSLVSLLHLEFSALDAPKS